MKRMNCSTVAAMALAAALLTAGQSEAAPYARSIYVNGQPMGPANMVVLDSLNCGQTVPSGRYWVNWVTRAWGYEGGAQQGWLPHCQRQVRASAPASKRYIEDRVFERYGVDMIHIPSYQ